MVDEFSVDFSNQKRTFISKLNPESPPFEPSYYYQHIQEVSQPKFSSEDNQNHLHIQPIKNDHQNDQNFHSTTIHSIEPSEHVSSQIHYIQETIPDYQQPTISSHIEPVNVSYDDKKEEDIDQVSFQQSNNEEVLNTNNDNQTSFDTQSNLNEKSNELKTQSELDGTEIPIDQSPTPIEANTSSNELESNIINTHPLTELESISSLPDVVAETVEKNSDNSVHPTEPDDILGNNSLLKQTITPGTPDTRLTRNTLATVSYKLFLIDNSTLNSRLIETITNESFFIGEYDILSAIDISIQLMDRGEHAFIDSDVRHCYGENGCEEKQIPPISSENSYRMKIDLEFHDWKYAPDIQTLTINDRLYWGDKKRQRGNFFYRRKEYSSALQCYQNALKFLDTTEYPLLEEDNQSSILINRYIQVQNNLAQVYLLNNQYEECLNAVNNVLKYDSNNIKGLFRQGKALIELGNYDHAIQPLKLLLQNPNEDVDKEKVKEMLNLCETKLATYQKNEKEIYKRMFQSKMTINEQPQIKKVENNNNNNNKWWAYVAMGSAALAAVGLAAIIKYR